MASASLAALPEELLQQIADLLDRNSQKSFALGNWRTWGVATNAIWRDLKLIDQRTHYHAGRSDDVLFDGHGITGTDEHDDLPMIRKLLCLYQNKRLAEKVRVVTHRCHLPLPAIFQDLPRMMFESPSLSADWRTIRLALIAARNMTNVKTVRLLNGHHNLCTALLNGFYGPERKRIPPHLWIESCSLHGFPLNMDTMSSKENGLKSLRLRRLKLVPCYNTRERSMFFCRAGKVYPMHNGTGSTYETTVNREGDIHWKSTLAPEDIQDVHECVKWLNAKTYEHFSDYSAVFEQICRDAPPLLQQARQDVDTIGTINSFNSNTLRSLNLDWILTKLGPTHVDKFRASEHYAHFERLSNLRFPNLRAFQLRNAVTENTILADDIYLLQPYTITTILWPQVPLADTQPERSYHIDMLTFMECHPNLECLAWPMDRFYAAYSGSATDRSISDRAAAVVANLGRTLTNLRVDFYYTSRGEPQTDDNPATYAREARIRRRAFISNFAAHMKKLTVLKLEGGIPRDEKREMMRATATCPIEKLVLIAVSCPLGNTWGVNGDDLSHIDEGQLQFHGLLEAEPEEALIENTKARFFPHTARESQPFRAEYGWPAGPSLLHSIALNHASTITELKFCGYNGSPILHKPTPITKALLHHLKHFHKLKKIVMSFWLLTFFDFDWREPEIIEYWLDQRESSSTALTIVPQSATAPPPEPPSWESMVADDAGLSATTDAEGDVSMSEGADWSSTVNALSALSGNLDGADEALNPDLMMAAALGTGGLLPAAPGVHGISAASAQNDLENMAIHAPQNHNANVAPPPPASTTMDEDDPNPWETALREKFSPKALSHGVAKIIVPHLSHEARRNVVNIRSSFCLGVESGDIFDLDFKVDGRKNGVIENSWVGPREEGETIRWWGKLEERNWFG